MSARRRGPGARLVDRLERRTGWRQKNRRERGVVVVWFALMLIVLMGFAGFAVDMSNWWFQAERLQRAADSGAHAGVVFLPGDLNGATTTARAEVAKNGYTTTGANRNGTLTVTQEPNPNRLRVKIVTEVPSYFVGLLGVESVTLTREAVAEYIAPVPMGSPENKLGNDPERNYDAAQFWVNIAGPNSTKGSGDRYQAKVCGSGVAGCGRGANPGIGNDEYSFDGYFFAMSVKSKPAGQALNITAYDAAFAYVGDKCGDVTFPSTTELNNLRTWYGTDANLRYAGGLTKWCSGDQAINGGKNTRTTFIVREPDDTPWSDTDNKIITSCTTTMPTYDLSTGQTIYQRLYAERSQTRDGKAPWTFSELFRRNVTLCSIPSADVKLGDYILQVRSNSTEADPNTYSASNTTGGHNRLSIQAGFGTTGPQVVDGTAVAINARGRMPIYANANSATTNFYLARILPYDAGRTLRVNLYDISDVGDSGTMKIKPPAEFASSFSGCAFSNDTNKSMTFNSSTCTLTVPNQHYNERSVIVDVPIPANYKCNDHLGLGCWLTVEAKFNGAVQDTTTWSAAILGNPVRLVE